LITGSVLFGVLHLYHISAGPLPWHIVSPWFLRLYEVRFVSLAILNSTQFFLGVYSWLEGVPLISNPAGLILNTASKDERSADVL
jgi:hypothetical protein